MRVTSCGGRVISLIFAALAGMASTLLWQNLWSSKLQLPGGSSVSLIARQPGYKKQLREEIALYTPGPVEAYVMKHKQELGLTIDKDMPPTCPLWLDPNYSKDDPTIYQKLRAYKLELEDYSRRVHKYTPAKHDLREDLFPIQDVDAVEQNQSSSSSQQERYERVCSQLELHEQGLPGIFQSGMLSHSDAYGYMEPLLPPLRHPRFCDPGQQEKYLMNMGYIIHDFVQICHMLKPHSRMIFIDMGASLEFHGLNANDEFENMPAIYTVALFRKFGFFFDHIYAFEITNIPAERVYSQLPDYLLASYHWINVGVSADPKNSMNPLKLVLDNFNEDDFIVIKLDIDTSVVEVPLAHQLLKDDRYANLIDQFYFEHHVCLNELVPWWGCGGVAKGTVAESLELFTGIRQKGIPIHYWP